jgi:hypothetical protein
MHWSGKIRIVAILVATAAMALLKYGLGKPWYITLSLGALAFIATPIFIGIALGMGDRREMKRIEEKIKRGEPID